MTAYYEDEAVTVHHGDCLDVLAELPDASIDAVVTDPPYDLTAGKKGGTGPASVNLNSPAGRARITAGFMGQAWDGTGIAFRPDVWIECLRVLKPGGHLLAFGGSRTWHRLACAVEDAGFEVRDSIAWLYGSGFPKSLDVSKAIDKAAGVAREDKFGGAIGRNIGPTGNKKCDQCGKWLVSGSPCKCPRPQDEPVGDDARRFAGFGTALKPAFEPIVVARKSLSGTVAANVLAHGTGALNIDGCRTATNGEELHTSTVPNDMRGGHYGSGHRPLTRDGEASADRRYTEKGGTNFAATPGPRGGSPAGRWPTNVLLDSSQADALDEQSGTLTSGKMQPTHTTAGVKGRNTYGADAAGGFTTMETYGDTGGASRFFPTFRYEAKAPTAERPRHGEIAHPTVKPLDLMRWLVRLVTPPGGTVLEPFAGSGTTAEACVIEGFRCIAVEREAAYLPLIVARLSKPIQPDLFGGVA